MQGCISIYVLNNIIYLHNQVRVLFLFFRRKTRHKIGLCMCVCVCVCMCVCLRVCERACMRACVRAGCVRVGVLGCIGLYYRTVTLQ